MPATPEQHRFYSALLFELGAPHNTSAGVSTLERLARDLLRRIAPRMLVVDEVDHLLAGSYREQRASLNLAIASARRNRRISTHWHLCLPGAQLPGLLADRWFFFAQARHPQNLYYQVIS